MNGQCERVEGLIIDYAMGELGSSDLTEVEEHMKSCLRCSQSLEDVQRIASVLSQQEVVEPSAALCHCVKEAVREKCFRTRTPFSALTAAAESLFRRPALAGATALLLTGIVTALLVIPGLRDTKAPRSRDSRKIEIGGQYLDPHDPRALERYLVLTQQLLNSLGTFHAQEVLASYDWMTWVSPAKTWKEKEGFEAYHALCIDLERLYHEIEACESRFGEGEITHIRNLIAELNLIKRTKEALEFER